MKKFILPIIIIVAVILAFVFMASKNTRISQVLNNNSIYCSSDGILTNTMPIQSHRSYCIKSDVSSKNYAVNTPNEYSFFIVDDQGNALKDFAITHTKLMHVIIVRKDLANFQHVHPEYNQTTGVFTLKDLKFPTHGQYRIFADFAPANGMKDPQNIPLGVTISHNIIISGDYTPQSIGSEEKTKTFDGYQVSLNTHDLLISGQESILIFDISQNGKPITNLENYLGALGHSVILRESTLDFIHAHPVAVKNQNGIVSFMINFPKAGKYKAFTQFQHNGRIFTTDFVVSVVQGTNNAESTEGVDHSMH